VTDVTVITPVRPGRSAEFYDRCTPSVKAQDYEQVIHLVSESRLTPGASRAQAAKFCETPLLAYLDDDDAFRANHVRLLAGALDARPEVGYAWSWMKVHLGTDHCAIWTGPPHFTIAVPMLMHRRELLSVANWPDSDECEEEQLLDAWTKAGITGVCVPEITVDVFADEERIKVLMLLVVNGQLTVYCEPHCRCDGKWLAEHVASVKADLREGVAKLLTSDGKSDNLERLEKRLTAPRKRSRSKEGSDAPSS
jgi:Glycosyl transferase family 2